MLIYPLCMVKISCCKRVNNIFKHRVKAYLYISRINLMSTITIAEQIQVIKEATKQASKSKEAALKFLISAGIEGRKAKISPTKRAKKQAKSR